MFGFGWGEMVVIGIVALIAIGPKELPTVLRSLGQAMGKIRRMAAEFQGQFHEAIREAELTDIKKQAEEFTSGMTNFDPLAETQKEVESALAIPDPSAPPAPSAETAAAPVTPVDTAPPQIDVPLPELPPALTEKDFAVADPAAPKEETPKQAGGKA